MQATDFPERNQMFGKPKNWDEERDGKIYELPVCVQEDPHNSGRIYCISAWKPTEQDFIEFFKGKPIYLQVWGGQPPVALYTVKDDGEPHLDCFEDKNEPVNFTKLAVGYLCERLSKDEDLRRGYIANIAIAFQDQFEKQSCQISEDERTVHSDMLHEISNRAAENFINLLINQTQQ